MKPAVGKVLRKFCLICSTLLPGGIVKKAPCFESGDPFFSVDDIKRLQIKDSGLIRCLCNDNASA